MTTLTEYASTHFPNHVTDPIIDRPGGDLTLTDHTDSTTVIHGLVADQAALHGLLQRLRDLGLPLLSVDRQTQHSGD